MKIKKNIRDVQPFWHLLLMAMVILTLFPIVFAVCNSFKTNSEAINTVMSLIPKNPTMENYFHVFRKLPFVRITLNTFIIAAVVTSLKTITSLLAAMPLFTLTSKEKESFILLCSAPCLYRLP